ncbi:MULTISPECIES: TetR/AcrR family transcriptional regulator [unclassified Microbacterium]|uniref:TetR/AcrR family transcriptional regulator n=1 Tax=unclassified Microbacterium TaxID=2609290 RepID=UPI000EA96054|nr:MULTISPECIES: TetR/AcrR family transcriptional regulator [unclassified Microbacterium]MBT2485203.1 TetR family transcriptional regulator [Microbacterium sp. ISL-108]RKN68031.1 TetR/AcrR family transcriptional regulator [Microbacterium sp. CGR2]
MTDARPATSEPARRGRPGYDRRGLLAAAVAVFNESGYDATSVAALATRLGLSKAALYHHFSSKEEILELALGEALDGLEGVLADTRSIRASERLASVLQGAVRVLAANLPAVTLLLRVRGNSEVERRALDRRRAFDQEVREIVRAAQGEGAVRADIDASVATRLLFGMVNSLVEWYRPGGAEDADALARDVLTVALDGLRTR